MIKSTKARPATDHTIPEAVRPHQSGQPLVESGVEPSSLSATAAGTPIRKTKSSLLRELLSAPGGASLQSLMSATGWQAHTVRAALTGLRKSGLTIVRSTSETGAIYASTTESAATENQPPASIGKPPGRRQRKASDAPREAEVDHKGDTESEAAATADAAVAGDESDGLSAGEAALPPSDAVAL